MTISIPTTNAGTSTQPITRITKDEFILQGYDIVQAYAKHYRVTAIRPYDGASGLADFMWERFADENGTIPLLREHTAVRISNGHLRIVPHTSDSEESTTHPMPDSTVDDTHPPIEPPELDEGHVLPQPFNRSKEPTAPRQIIPFPSPPEDPVFSDPASLEPSIDPVVTPTLDPVHSPLSPIDEQDDYENPCLMLLMGLLEKACQFHQRLQKLFNSTQAELASAVLEIQHAKIELDLSMEESQATMNQLRNVFGTKCALKVMNAKEMKKRHGKSPVENTSTSSSYGDDNDTQTNSRPETWSSRESPNINNHETTEHDANRINVIDHSHKNVSEVPEIDVLSTHEGSSRSSIEGIPPCSPRSRGSSLGKRAREETLDSEAEVETSIRCDEDPLTEYPKKVRLDQAGTSFRVSRSRRGCLKQSHDMDVDDSNSKPVHRVRFPEDSAPSSSISSHVQIIPNPPPVQSGSSEQPQPSTSAGRPRPLVRSTSTLLEAEDGGCIYWKYYPPKKTSHRR